MSTGAVLNGRVAVVTGGNRGIGLAIARAMATASGITGEDMTVSAGVVMY
jgi:NAD(P)-dependent dehydrogenase (short-subunit alcohol dehydrogenase family)